MTSEKPNSTLHHCIYIDNGGVWWQAETIGHPSNGDLRPIAHITNDILYTIKKIWSDVVCVDDRRIILYVDGDTKKVSAFGSRRLLV